MVDGELLTSDENAARKPRWSETRDLPNAIRALAKLHHLDDDSGAIDESEEWSEFVTELASMITELITQLSKGTEDR